MVSLVLSNSLGSLVSLWPQSSLCRAFLWLGLHWPSKKRTKKEKRQRGMVSGFGGWHHHWLQWWVPLPHGFGSCRQILSLPLDHRGLEHRREARRERERERKQKRKGEPEYFSIFEITVYFVDAGAQTVSPGALWSVPWFPFLMCCFQTMDGVEDSVW